MWFPSPTPAGASRVTQFELRFQSLHREGRALSFPCDDHGVVPMDQLSERARANYLYARAVVGRDFGCPQVCSVPTTH